MKSAPLPANELERLADLNEYNIMDTIAEKDYDDITRIAADICDMPISLISLIDKNRQWFKSKLGLEPQETHRDLAFCAHAILTPDETFIVPDSSKDDRFSDNPLVTGGPRVNFYAGVPLVNAAGNAMGSLCVIDTKPNNLTKEQEQTLKALARQVVSYLEIRKKTHQLAVQKTALEQVNGDLQRFAYVVAHDIKSPCGSLAMGAEYLSENYADKIDADGLELLNLMKTTSHTAIRMVDGILQHTLTVNKEEGTKERFKFEKVVADVKKLLDIPSGFTLNVVNGEEPIFASYFMLQQVLLNLCSNAIKYNDKDNGEITITAVEKEKEYTFSVQDNGCGIRLKDQGKIFELFNTLGTTDRYNKQGTGIGLSTVKRIVEKMGGAITVRSEVGSGSVFEFTVRK
jgi:signal transduction histidine kinase